MCTFCAGLTNITKPSSVKSIDNYVFMDCTSLTSITFQGAKEQWNSILFGSGWDGSSGAYTIHCTDGDIVKA